MKQVLFFGGSFDPIHHGHLIVARFVAEHRGIARVILVPSASPPHKQHRRLTAPADRLAMCQLAVADEPLFEVTDWEVGRPGPNYTLDTVTHYRQTLDPDNELCWLIGMDSLLELESWHRAAELVDLCTIVTTARPGCAPPDAAALGRRFSPPQIARLLQNVVAGPRVDIAGTDIRARVRAGRSIRFLTPDAVCRHITEHGLYRQ